MDNQPSTPTFDFLTSRIHLLLDECGFANLSEATRSEYVPQFEAEAERRLGLALLPRLTESAGKELLEILKREDVSPAMVADFWKKYVPDFEDVVKKTLDDFAVEVKTSLTQIRNK